MQKTVASNEYRTADRLGVVRFISVRPKVAGWCKGEILYAHAQYYINLSPDIAVEMHRGAAIAANPTPTYLMDDALGCTLG